MIYVGCFSYEEKPAKDVKGHHSTAYFVLLVEADSLAGASERFKDKIIELRRHSELLFDAKDVYMQSIAELDGVPRDGAAMTQWFSVAPFGDCVSEISFIPDGNREFEDCVSLNFGEEEPNGEDMTPFISFSGYDEQSTPLYFDLLREKRRGYGIGLEDMSHGGLVYLHGEESISLEMLAELFEVSTEEVGRRLSNC